MTQTKVTLSEAAKATGISRKTLYRWIDKGLLSKEKDGNKSIVSLEDVRALCDQHVTPGDTVNVTSSVTGNVSGIQQGTPEDTARVTVDVTYLEGLLVRLGQLEAEKRYLLEYKGGLEQKDVELTEAKQVMKSARAKIEELQIELERVNKRSWWSRLWKK